jgi:hypothetical protein
MNKSKLLDNLTYIIGLVTIVLIVVLSKHIMNSLIVGGIGAALYGVASIMKKERTGFLILSLGIGTTISTLLYRFDVFDKFEAIQFMIGLTVFVLMALSGIFLIVKQMDIKKRYDLIVEATVIDLEANPNTKKEYYKPLYQYEVDGLSYEVAYPTFINKHIPSIGSKVKLMIESKDPMSVYFEESLNSKIYNIATIIFLLIVSLIVLVDVFK